MYVMQCMAKCSCTCNLATRYTHKVQKIYMTLYMYMYIDYCERFERSRHIDMSMMIDGVLIV